MGRKLRENYSLFAYFRDEHIQRKCGKDAVQYLLFQRYLILYTAIICVLCIGVVLPVNFQGDLGEYVGRNGGIILPESDNTSFLLIYNNPVKPPLCHILLCRSAL